MLVFLNNMCDCVSGMWLLLRWLRLKIKQSWLKYPLGINTHSPTFGLLWIIQLTWQIPLRHCECAESSVEALCWNPQQTQSRSQIYFPFYSVLFILCIFWHQTPLICVYMPRAPLHHIIIDICMQIAWKTTCMNRDEKGNSQLDSRCACSSGMHWLFHLNCLI